MTKFEFDLFPQYTDYVKIGKGGFATVYSALYMPAGHRVAIKYVPKEHIDSDINKRNFFREIDILKKVDHPFFAHFFNLIESEIAFYVVMELASNGTLLTRLNTTGELSIGEAKKVFAQLISAVSYLHNELKIIHRDIKLENILFDDNGNVRLVDFGLSCAMKTESDHFHTLCGSYPYAAPEIFQRTPYGVSIDVWSLGICLFASVAGYLPFSHTNTTKLIKSIVTDEPEYPNSLPNSLELCLKSMLTKDPKDRISITKLASHPFFADSCVPFFMDVHNLNVTPSIQTGLDPEIATILVKRQMDPLKATELGSEEATLYRILRSAKIAEIVTQTQKRRPVVPILKKGSAPDVPRSLATHVKGPNVISLDRLPVEALRFRKSSMTRNIGSVLQINKRDNPAIMRPSPFKAGNMKQCRL